MATRHSDDRLRQLLGLAADADVSRLQAELAASPPAPDTTQQQQTVQAGSGQSATVAPGQTGTPAGTVGIPAQATASTAPVAQGAPIVDTTTATHTPGAEHPQGDTQQTGQTTAQQAGQLVNASAAPAGQAATVTPEGHVMLSAAQWAGVQELIATQAEQRREGVLAAALSSGRLSPAEAQGWRNELVRDEDSATRMLGLLPANRVPVAALGSLGSANLSQHDAAADAACASFEDSLGLDLNRTPAPTTAHTAATQTAVAAQQIGA